MVSMMGHLRIIHTIQIILLAAGAGLAFLGLSQGEAKELLGKAIIICMECIGIG